MTIDEAIHYARSNEKLLKKGNLKLIGLATIKRKNTNLFHYAEIAYNSLPTKSNTFVVTHITGAIPSFGKTNRNKYSAYDPQDIKNKLPKALIKANFEIYFSQHLETAESIEDTLAVIVPTTDNSQDALINGYFEAQCGSYIEHLNKLNHQPTTSTR